MSARKLGTALVAALLAVLAAVPAASATTTLTPAAALAGTELTCARDAIDGTEHYEWSDGGGDPIAGAADQSTYTTTLADRGKEIWCAVTRDSDSSFEFSGAPSKVAGARLEGELFGTTFTGSVGALAAPGTTVTVQLLRRGGVVASGTDDALTPDGGWQVDLPNAFANGRDAVRVSYAGPLVPEDALFSADSLNVNPFIGYRDGNGDNPFDVGGDTAVKVQSFCFECTRVQFSSDGTTWNDATPAGFGTWEYAGAFDRLSTLSIREEGIVTPKGSTQSTILQVTRQVPPVGTAEWTPPTCQADLASTAIRCRGVSNPGGGQNPYSLRLNGGPKVATTFGVFGGDLLVEGNRGHGPFVTAKLAGIKAGDVVELVLDPGDHVLTRLTVAGLRADIAADGRITGTCRPGQYLDVIRADNFDDSPVCPGDGRMDATNYGLFSYDDMSGGRTEVRVPQIVDLQPAPNATVSGTTVALKAATRYYADEIPGYLSTDDPVQVTVTPQGGGAPVSAANVNGAGASVTLPGPGRYTARWTVTDRNGDTRTIATAFTVAAGTSGTPGTAGAAGGSQPGGGTQPGTTPRTGGGPVASAAFAGRIGMSATRFRAATRGGPVASAAKKRKKQAPVGTLVTYRLTAAGTVTFAVERKVAGRRARRSSGRCVKPSKATRKNRSCKRTEVLKGAFTQTGRPGVNTFRFTGRLRGKALKPGAYTLRAVTGGPGKSAKAQRKAFRIVK